MSNDYTNELLALNEELGYTNAEGTTGAIIDCDDTVQIVDRDINMKDGTVCAVCCDSNSQLLSFEIDRYVEGVDLSTKILSIKFQNALKQCDRAEPHSIGVSDERITFTWLLDKRVTAGEGTVTFQIEFYEVVDEKLYSWQTNLQTFEIRPTLNVDGSIETPSPTWVQEIQIAIKRLEAKDKSITERIDTAESVALQAVEYVMKLFATFSDKPLVAGITSELSVNLLYKTDIDSFDIMVDDALLNSRTPINGSMRIATELLSAENTRIVLYEGDSIAYKCGIRKTISNFGVLFVV